MHVEFVLDAMPSPIKDQRVRVSFNGRHADELSCPVAGRQLRLSLDGIEGLNNLNLAFARWNGKPYFFAHADSRPLALRVRQITIRWDTGAAQLLPTP
jgi:hypothetical protein